MMYSCNTIDSSVTGAYSYPGIYSIIVIIITLVVKVFVNNNALTIKQLYWKIKAYKLVS